MLVTLKEILNYAEANKCAIGAFHILSEDNLTAVLDAAQELCFPVIIMHSQENEKSFHLPTSVHLWWIWQRKLLFRSVSIWITA